ncbi:hypothetical protein [Pyxidicoccus caerfyrddinensis]|uniref:hypothetical protein n=1 Tax=Pyxidicoccus caerfyrddinensis TaxID=2709663 RepID=UPI0013D906F4|nr:hypothetical protein [Pyxidicoccus caerfyrddinensis]
MTRELINAYDSARNGRGRLRGAIDEIRQGRALGYHQTQTSRRFLVPLLDDVLHVPAADRAARLADWDWFLASGPPGSTPRATNADWTARRTAFLDSMKVPVESRLARFNPADNVAFDATLNWLQNLPQSVHELIQDVSHAEIPPAFVYSAAANEGLVDQYIRPQVPGAGVRLNAAQLSGIRVDLPVDGFMALGIDTFFTELGYTHQPLRSFFPAGFDVTQMVEITYTNEKGETVRSARAPNLRMGLQAQVAMLRRRRALFLEDQTSLGFAAPLPDELVYFAYIYYNVGPGDRAHPDAPGNGGYQTLYRHRPAHPNPAERRVLGDWISQSALWYRNAMKVLVTYRFVSDATGGHPVIFAGL